MPSSTKEDLRASALRQLNEEWASAIEQGGELGRVFGRLLGAQRDCHGFGLHTSVEFEDELTQRSWNEFRRMNNDMVPTDKEQEPPHMLHEDTIYDQVMEEATHGDATGA